MDKVKKISKGFVTIIAFLTFLQLLRFGLKSVFFLFADRSDFNDRLASFLAIVFILVLILLITRIKKIPLSVFPKRFHWLYFAVTVVAVVLLILTPVLTKDYSFYSVFLLIYAAVLIPVFEELIFRSLVWNKLNTLFQKEWVTYIVDSVLFALWHFGYADSLSLRIESGLWAAMFWKAITGFCFGLVLGIVRLKTKNSYSTMVLHGVMNIFGR